MVWSLGVCICKDVDRLSLVTKPGLGVLEGFAAGGKAGLGHAIVRDG